MGESESHSTQTWRSRYQALAFCFRSEDIFCGKAGRVSSSADCELLAATDLFVKLKSRDRTFFSKKTSAPAVLQIIAFILSEFEIRVLEEELAGLKNSFLSGS